jgi:hypothetical protein
LQQAITINVKHKGTIIIIVKHLSIIMRSISMDDENLVRERSVFEFQKYGRRLHQELAAHAHVYRRHSIPQPYGAFDEPVSPDIV